MHLRGNWHKSTLNNRHIQAKIRQELQILRDYGIIEFVERGKYKMRRAGNGVMN